MNVKAYNREIHYDFTQQEVDLLKSLDVWDDVRNRLMEHERITVEGYERIEVE